MVNCWLIYVPEEFVDTLLFNKEGLVGSVERHLRGMGQARRHQEQRDHFHPRVCFAKDRPYTDSESIYIPLLSSLDKSDKKESQGTRLGDR